MAKTMTERVKELYWCNYMGLTLMRLCIADPEKSEEEKADARRRRDNDLIRIHLFDELFSGHEIMKERVRQKAVDDAIEQYNRDNNKTDKYWF